MYPQSLPHVSYQPQGPSLGQPQREHVVRSLHTPGKQLPRPQPTREGRITVIYLCTPSPYPMSATSPRGQVWVSHRETMWSDLYTHRVNSYRDHSQLEKVGLQYSHIFGHGVVYLTLERDKLISQRSGLEVIKTFFKLSLAEHEISTAHKC